MMNMIQYALLKKGEENRNHRREKTLAQSHIKEQPHLAATERPLIARLCESGMRLIMNRHDILARGAA